MQSCGVLMFQKAQWTELTLVCHIICDSSSGVIYIHLMHCDCRKV